MGIPDYLTCLLRNLYAGQEATVRTGHLITPLPIGRQKLTVQAWWVMPKKCGFRWWS